MEREIHLSVCKCEAVAGKTDWRPGMRRGMVWLLTIKFAALILLWWLFFSPPHRQHIGGEAASERLAVAPAAGAADTQRQAEEKTRD